MNLKLEGEKKKKKQQLHSSTPANFNRESEFQFQNPIFKQPFWPLSFPLFADKIQPSVSITLQDCLLAFYGLLPASKMI